MPQIVDVGGERPVIVQVHAKDNLQVLEMDAKVFGLPAGDWTGPTASVRPSSSTRVQRVPNRPVRELFTTVGGIGPGGAGTGLVETLHESC